MKLNGGLTYKLAKIHYDHVNFNEIPLQKSLINFSDVLQVELEKKKEIFQQFQETKTICKQDEQFATKDKTIF